MTKTWLGLSIVVGLVFMLATPVLADFQAGLDAYDRTDYETALKEFRPLAEKEYAPAQFQLGEMYQWALGVPQDQLEAVKWYRGAAEQGYTQAQNFLGWMYYMGWGVSQDYVLAHMWANLAAAKGNRGAIGLRKDVSSLMTPAQLTEAQRLASEWKVKGP